MLSAIIIPSLLAVIFEISYHFPYSISHLAASGQLPDMLDSAAIPLAAKAFTLLRPFSLSILDIIHYISETHSSSLVIAF